MGAQLRPRPDRDLYEGVERPELLRQVTGLTPDGNHVFLQDAGFKSLQRLVFADINGGVLVALYPGELKPHAIYLYSDRHAEAFVGAASEGGWDVESNPHLAFFQAPAHQRLYMEPTIDLAQYVDLWQGPGRERIGGYWPEELRQSLWPWLKEQGVRRAKTTGSSTSSSSCLARNASRISGQAS